MSQSHLMVSVVRVLVLCGHFVFVGFLDDPHDRSALLGLQQEKDA